MAIFGDFSDLPFPETFSMVGRRSGRLLVSEVPGQGSFELHMVEGALRGLRIDDEEIDDPLCAQDRLAALMGAPCGFFQFYRCAPENLQGGLNLPLLSLLMSLASAVDEITAYRERFLHPRTRFQRSAGDSPLAEELDQFVQRSMPYLHRGTDAEELARALGISLDRVQLYLHKLRSTGWVIPVSEAGEATPAPSVSATDGPSWDDTIDQLFRSLRERMEAA